MATTSNAFNFSSFMQSSVDPRTGLYTLSIDLPALNANDLCGPDLPLQLNFSPMSNENYGFGIGWRLKLSSFNITTGMLSLHTGESFKVADNGPGNAPVIAEKKIDSFHFTNISAGTKKRIRIAHKSGLIEILEPQEKDPETALPVRVMGASGHGVNLAYDTTEAKPRLKSITDDTKHILLEIKYPTNNRTEFTFNPTTRSAARYTLDLVNNELRKVTLPTSSDEYWELHYKLYDRFPFLSKVENPDKGVEEITYHEGKTGHKYPGIDRYLPAVKAHLIMPDVPDTTTHILTEYTYSNNNFLGNGTGLTYGEENGTDQLYRFTGHTFEYNSTAKHFRDKKEYRTVVSTFNRFHLMTSQATTDDGCIETITTTYNELENLEFKYQPNHFQLPLTVRKSWAKAGDPTVGDYEETKTTYDIHGNLLTELKPDGTSMRRTYYPGMDDPEGFERNLKFMVIYPATPSSPDEPLAQLISSEFTYASLPALPQNNPDLNMPEWLLLEKEDIFEGEGEARQLLNSKIRRYLNKVDTPFQHGRVDQQITQINDATTTSDWKYEKVKDGNDQLTWSRSTETFTDHTHTLEKKTATTYSMHNGQVVLEHDANNVFTHYEHDVLGRVIAETASPGTPYATTRATAYKLLDESGRKRTCEETTDSKGVVTRTVFDGSRRPIREEREAKDAVTGVVVKRTVAEFNYDSAGRLVSEIGYDYLPDKDGKPEPRVLKLESKYKYDGWGQQCEEERPDGIKERIDATPLEPGGQLITRWTESPNAPGHRLQQTVSKLNRFSKPVYECRLLEEEVKAPDESTHRVTREAGRTDFTYDGTGRCVSRSESILDPRNNNEIISVGMGYNEGNDYRSMSVNASGAVMLHGDGLAFGSHLGETMALVHVPDVAGVGVQNTSSARTNAQGYALGPYLRPYRLNSLVLQTDDLSPEVVIGNASQQVVPRRGAVVKASYEAEHVGRLVLTLRQANGQPVPFGAQVLDADGQSLGVVGQAGQALVSTRTTGPQTIRVLWGEASDKACTLHIDPQALAQEGGYRLQTLHCQLPVASSQPLLPGDNTQETL